MDEAQYWGKCRYLRELLLVVDNLNSLEAYSRVCLSVCRVSVQDGVSIWFCQRDMHEQPCLAVCSPFRTGKEHTLFGHCKQSGGILFKRVSYGRKQKVERVGAALHRA